MFLVHLVFFSFLGGAGGAQPDVPAAGGDQTFHGEARGSFRASGGRTFRGL